MKKLLWIVFILLFLGAGYVYLVKNPELPISQKILTTLGINKTVPQGTGIDLTNCVNYFDGCNNCSVKDGKVDACTLMYCETPSAPKCNKYASGTETTGTVGLANPASTNCVNNGGSLEILEGSGGQYGMCHLSDGTSCEERAYFRGECGTTTNTGNAGTSPGNPGEQTVCTMEYAPVCASVQVQCIKAPCDPIEKTFGNKCMMNANKSATFLHDGECAAADCPQRSQPAPSFCTNGIIVDGGKDANGCQLPPICQK